MARIDICLKGMPIVRDGFPVCRLGAATHERLAMSDKQQWRIDGWRTVGADGRGWVTLFAPFNERADAVRWRLNCRSAIRLAFIGLRCYALSYFGGSYD